MAHPAFMDPGETETNPASLGKEQVERFFNSSPSVPSSIRDVV